MCCQLYGASWCHTCSWAESDEWWQQTKKNGGGPPGRASRVWGLALYLSWVWTLENLRLEQTRSFRNVHSSARLCLPLSCLSLSGTFSSAHIFLWGSPPVALSQSVPSPARFRGCQDSSSCLSSSSEKPWVKDRGRELSALKGAHILKTEITFKVGGGGGGGNHTVWEVWFESLPVSERCTSLRHWEDSVKVTPAYTSDCNLVPLVLGLWLESEVLC